MKFHQAFGSDDERREAGEGSEMEKHLPLFIMVAAAAVALAAFACYRWRQSRRVRGVNEWIGAYLRDRFGGPLDRVSINCSDDRLWPVLVGCDDRAAGFGTACDSPAQGRRRPSRSPRKRKRRFRTRFRRAPGGCSRGDGGGYRRPEEVNAAQGAGSPDPGESP